MKTFALLIIAIAATNAQKRSIKDLNLQDNRKPLDLSTSVQGQVDEKINSNKIDITAETVTPIFRDMLDEHKETGNMIEKNVFYKIDKQINNNTLVQYRVYKNPKGRVIYKVIIHSTNDNAANPKKRKHIQRMRFKCKNMRFIKTFMCIPAHCKLRNYEPEPTPAMKCEDSYNRSQALVTEAFEVMKDVKKLKAMIDCINKKVQVMALNKKSVCYYAGFRPNNIVSLEELSLKLKRQGWKKQKDGTFKRVVSVDQRSADVRVNQMNDVISNL